MVLTELERTTLRMLQSNARGAAGAATRQGPFSGSAMVAPMPEGQEHLRRV
ncbi:hypothetical protein U5922_002065 [Aquicoccus sp. G2-2]|uniref:hypothetical protein n=1 Tax=Aquicoccus sp. G2-2 TaxID=3092120 RepID=UPI002ADF3118|nr:hypothetical protein [Aquicoccus sp. G2-2]MEA1112314.1 hypothetical protein [Aquicoccus sp. G2-2]